MKTYESVRQHGWLIGDLLNCSVSVAPRVVCEIRRWDATPPRRALNSGYRERHVASTTPYVSPRSNHSAWVCLRDEASAATEKSDISVGGGGGGWSEMEKWLEMEKSYWHQSSACC